MPWCSWNCYESNDKYSEEYFNNLKANNTVGIPLNVSEDTNPKIDIVQSSQNDLDAKSDCSNVGSGISEIEYNSFKEEEKAKLKVMIFQFASKVVCEGINILVAINQNQPTICQFLMDKSFMSFKLKENSVEYYHDSIEHLFQMKSVQTVSKDTDIIKEKFISDMFNSDKFYAMSWGAKTFIRVLKFYDFMSQDDSTNGLNDFPFYTLYFYECYQNLYYGGCGYIGSHTAIKLINIGYKVYIIDNLSNSKKYVLNRIKHIVNEDVQFFEIDLLNKCDVIDIFNKHHFDAVIHYAGLKAVGESTKEPLSYYKNNLIGTMNLLEAMRLSNCRQFIFSSSATVYQASEKPLKEYDILHPSNPYGYTKYFIEQILIDLSKADPTWLISILRYFNPIGAHESGLIGESCDHPMNLFPNILLVASGKKDYIEIYGNDWETPDGTGIRDYIHIEDLVDGHISALNYLNTQDSKKGLCSIHNLGTGKGISVMEMISEFEKATQIKIPFKVTKRRPGDLAIVVADPSKAFDDLNWKPTRTLNDACVFAWKWILSSKETN